MLTYSLSDTGADSLYLYLYKCIKNDILNGILPSGTKLPSKRSFAKNLGVSNITVESSYGLLQSEGYIFSLPKRGFYVSDIAFAAVPRAKDGENPKPRTAPAGCFAADTAPGGNALQDTHGAAVRRMHCAPAGLRGFCHQPHHTGKLPVFHLGKTPARDHLPKKRRTYGCPSLRRYF